VSLGIAISIGEADYIGVNSFPGAVIATYFFLFTGIGKNNKKYIMKRDFPISFFKINLSKFISFYVMLILLSVIIFYFEMSRGAELMPTLIELLKIYIGYYFGASFLGKMFEITDTKTVVNIPNVLYILTASDARDTFKWNLWSYALFINFIANDHSRLCVYTI
jgi:hypothetical protein